MTCERCKYSFVRFIYETIPEDTLIESEFRDIAKYSLFAKYICCYCDHVNIKIAADCDLDTLIYCRKCDDCGLLHKGDSNHDRKCLKVLVEKINILEQEIKKYKKYHEKTP